MIHQQMKSACYRFLPRINEANQNKKGVHDTQRDKPHLVVLIYKTS